MSTPHAVPAVFRGALLVPALLLASSPAARAEPVVFAFQGRVQFVFDGRGAVDDAVTVGSRLAGYYVFESTTPNSSDFKGEGQEGIYHHGAPPAGVWLRVGQNWFGSHRLAPDFDIVVHNDFGFVGSDDYGFISRRNVARYPSPPGLIDRLDIHWLATTAPEVGTVFDSVALPLWPPDLRAFNSNTLTIYGECTPCAAPAAFFRIEATLTSLRRIPPWHARADTNLDGRVDRADFADLARHFGAANMSFGADAMTMDGDLDGDGAVTLMDLGLLRQAFSTDASLAAAAVPEPPAGVVALAALAACGGWAGRPRRTLPHGAACSRHESPPAARPRATLRRTVIHVK
jgi:hypothetical protein